MLIGQPTTLINFPIACFFHGGFDRGLPSGNPSQTGSSATRRSAPRAGEYLHPAAVRLRLFSFQFRFSSFYPLPRTLFRATIVQPSTLRKFPIEYLRRESVVFFSFIATTVTHRPTIDLENICVVESVVLSFAATTVTHLGIYLVRVNNSRKIHGLHTSRSFSFGFNR